MNNSLPRLFELPEKVRYFFAAFLLVLTIGVSIGLVYVNRTTAMTADGTTEHYAGSTLGDEFDIPEYYPKPKSDMLMTTHNHIISFAMIFGMIGLLFYFNSMIMGTWKFILMAEPLISTIITFGSIWGIRFIAPEFAFITIIAGILMYFTYYIMVGIMLYELLLYSEKPIRNLVHR